MAEKQQELLEIGVSLKQIVVEMQKWQRTMEKTTGSVAKSVDKLNQQNIKTTKKAKESNKEWASSIEDLTDLYGEEAKAIKKTHDTIAQLEALAERSDGNQKKSLKENIKLLKERASMQAKAVQDKDSKEGRSNSARIMRESGEEVADSLKKVFEDSSLLFSKDLKSSLENGSKFMIKAIKASAATAALKGAKLQSYGAGLADRAKDKKGATGMALRFSGNAFKQMGGLMSKLNPVILSLTKIGPILGMVGTGIMSVVKLFLDLDAKAKEFNKDILQSAGTSSLLAKAGGDVDAAWERAEVTLKGLRDSANSFDNIEWGLKADDHKAMINVLTQEGLSIQDIGGKASKSAEEVQAFASDLMHVSVAYSRAFGVPLQEINQLQAEMVQDLGIGLNQTKMAFEQVNRAAQEAGVEGNRFFAMIRGVSQDLSLWNNRMADATLLLGKLMKNMSPRTAQSFFQTIQKGFKGTSRTELLKTALLNGVDSSMKAVKAEIARNIGGLAQTVGQGLGYSDDQVGALAERIKTQGRSAVEPLINQLDDKTQASVREALTRMELMQNRSKKGLYGIGEAMSDLGPVAAAEAKRNIALRFASSRGAKGKSMVSAAGEIGVGAMAENQGLDIETYNQIAMMEQTMEDQRKLLESRLGDPEVQKRLAKAGIKATQEGITEASWTQLMDTLSEDQQDLLKGVSETERSAKKQAKAQMSFYDKFDVLVDFLMNKLYNLFTGIWDTILSFPFVGDKFKNKRELSEKTLGTDLGQVLNAKDPSKAMAESKSMKDLNANLLALAKDPARKVEFDNAVLKMAKVLGTKNLVAAANMSGVGDVQTSVTSDDALSQSLTSLGGISDSDMMVAQSRLRSDVPVETFLSKFNPEEIVRILEKGVAWTGDETTKVAAALEGLESLNMKAAQNAGSGAEVSPAMAVTAPTVSPSTPTTVADTMRVADNNLNLSKDQLKTMQSIDNQMDRFKMDTSFLSGPYSKSMEGASLKALRTALFEYYMYKDLDQANVVSTMQSAALNPASFAESFTMGAAAGLTGTQQLDRLSANASGGMVTGVSNGLAQVTAAAGEGLASVGRGERILPAGSGSNGPNINVTVQGIGGQDLARYVRAKVIEGVYEYKKKERFS